MEVEIYSVAESWDVYALEPALYNTKQKEMALEFRYPHTSSWFCLKHEYVG